MARQARFRCVLRVSALSLLALVGAPHSRPQEAPTVTFPADEIRSLASRILHGAEKADCHPGKCIILVQNFRLASGQTSQLGMQLADEVAKQFLAQQTAIKIVERSRLRSYLERERIPDTLLNNERAFQWLGKQLGATTVLNGTTETRGDVVRVEASLFSCEKEKAAPQEGFSLPSSEFASALTPADSFPQNLPSPEDASAPLIQRAGVDGISSPACGYCPNPDYTDPARKVKFNGDLVLEVTVSAEGNAIDTRVVRGLPFGLNQSAIKTLRAWKLRPATREGQPLACRVMIEVTFRLK
jgi:TonB family protein